MDADQLLPRIGISTSVHEGIAGLRRAGWQCFVPILLVNLAAVLAASGEADAALETVSEALSMTRASGELAWEAEALRVLGGVKLATRALIIGAAAHASSRQPRLQTRTP
jgi:hypothetical protein